MGSGASLPQKLDKDTVKQLSGIHFDELEFDRLQVDGCITKEQYLTEVSKHLKRINNKFCEVTEVFSKNIWEPLLKSSFYHILFDSNEGVYSKYDAASVTERRKMLFESCDKMSINLQSLYCEKSCQRSFTDGSVCSGTVGVSGGRLKRSSNVDGIGGCSEEETLWSDFDTCDPDDVAIHLWTYSMAGTRQTSNTSETENSAVAKRSQEAFYRRVNMALLQDDPEKLAHMSYIICGIIRWIRRQKFTPEHDVVLYRGTPISEKQQHEVGHALKARSTGVSDQTHAISAEMCRMPLFIASSASLETAQQFTSIRSNGVACPILEFVLPKGQICDSVACVEPLSHFPDEKEWLMCGYSPFRYRSQRLEYLEIGPHSQLKLVMIVQYTVLQHQSTFAKFEAAGQDIKTAMLLCKPFLYRLEKMEEGMDMICGNAASGPATTMEHGISSVQPGIKPAELDSEIEIQRRKIRLIEAEVREADDHLVNCKQLKETKEYEKNSILNDLRDKKKEIMDIRRERESVLKRIAEYEKKMKPLLAEERAAFKRWEAREKAKEAAGIKSPLTWEEKLQLVDRAKREFIDYVFPPEELRALKDELLALKNKEDLAHKDIARFKQECADLAAECRELEKEIIQFKEVIRSLKRDLRREVEKLRKLENPEKFRKKSKINRSQSAATPFRKPWSPY